MKLSPLPPPIFLPSSKSTIAQSSLTSLHLQHFNLTLSTMNTNDEGCGRQINGKRIHEGVNSRPKLSLTLGYGKPLAGDEALWISNAMPSVESQQCNNVCNSAVHHNYANDDKATVSASSVYSAKVKLDVEQQLSTSQSCHGTVEYCHTGQVFSFGTMAMRTFSSSRFSRLGVGLRHSFGNIFSDYGPWWKHGSTSWLFQLERGDVCFLVPVTIFPLAPTAWDSLLRIWYASLASIVVDVIVGELLCGVTSKLRLSFFKLLLGEEKVGEMISPVADNDDMDKEQDFGEEYWLQQQLSKAKEDTLRQVNLMVRQAKAMTKKEEEQGGLRIVKAVYGVMDDESREWIRRKERNADSTNVDELLWHTMDATTQLQFWVTDSHLHLPAVSKKHMLGFYDMLAFVSEDEWAQSKQGNREGDKISYAFPRSWNWWKEKHWAVENKRNLVVVLSVRYRLDDKMYDVMLYDDDAVDLPSQFAQEVSDVESSSK
mmetsp:Transcript_31916/g.67099  ORF Transcript_31916/g.67099 Transcript_31916/m.67099 type:complete len:485 (+) Transcript_31916:780-2234(+)